MFRENALVDERIIERIASTMVPVALDYRRVQDARTKEAEFLTPLMKQRKQDQGVWIFSPDGKALGGFVGFGDMVGQTTTVIDGALKAFGDVAPRKIEPVAPAPRGSIVLAQYVRPTKESLAHLHTRSPVIAALTLSEKEFRELAPRGDKWTVPEAVARKFCRLSSPLCFQHAPQPDWVTAARLEGELVGATVRYRGEISTAHRVRGNVISKQSVTLAGEGVLKDGQLQSLRIVGSGTLHWPEAPQKMVTFDALVEWEKAK